MLEDTSVAHLIQHPASVLEKLWLSKAVRN